MATCSGVVTQSGDAKTLTFTDTGTGYVNVTSRQLNIFDSNGALVNSINMGSSLTAQQSITKDVWYSFQLSVTDDSGNVLPYPCIVNYRSQQFYNLAQVQYTVSDTDCNCGDQLCNFATEAREAINSSVTFFDIGDGESCQFMLDTANTLINKAIFGM